MRQVVHVAQQHFEAVGVAFAGERDGCVQAKSGVFLGQQRLEQLAGLGVAEIAGQIDGAQRAAESAVRE